MAFDLQLICFRLRELGIALHSLATDSRRVRPGDTFIACPGEMNDGRAFIGQAIAAGANAVLWESGDGFMWNPSWRAPQLGVAGLRRHSGEIAAQVYGDPSQQMRTIGVTGTNGKTSCSHWIAQALNRLGRKSAVIGTLGAGLPGELRAGTHTTPDAVALQKLLAEYRRQGAECAVMEVSSHGLTQHRVNGIAFDTALFTNLTRDHLDYHGDMQTYAAAKAELFRWPGLRHAVINVDDYYGAAIAAEVSHSDVELLGYGFNDAALAARNLQLTAQGLRFDVIGRFGEARLQSRALGRFNAANLLGALGVLLAGGVDLNDAASALAEVGPIAGRLQMLGGGDRPLVVVDFAHTPDALGNALAALRELLDDQSVVCGGDGPDRAQKTRKLICVFGCGGDRDRGKRPIMAEVATRLADHVIVTSDNPRFENPRAIIDEIMAGAGAQAVQIFEDRAIAIAEAIHTAHCGDIVLIAGKGHEEYQEINSVRLPFSDVAAARRELGEREPHVCNGASN